MPNIRNTVTHVPHRYATRVKIGVEPAGTQGPQDNINPVGQHEAYNRYRAFVNQLRVDMQTPAAAVQDKYLVGEFNRLLEVVGRNRTYTAETLAECLGMCGNVLAIAIAAATRRRLLKESDEVSTFSTIALGAGNVNDCETLLDACMAWLNDVGFVLPSHLKYLKHRLGWAKDSETGTWEDDMLFMNNVIGTIVNDGEIATDTTLTALQNNMYDMDSGMQACMRDIAAQCKVVKLNSYDQLVADKITVDEFKFITITTGGWGKFGTVKVGNLTGYTYETPAKRNESYQNDTLLSILVKQSARDEGIDPLDYIAWDATVPNGLVSPGRQTIMLDSTLLRSFGDPDETTIYGSVHCGFIDSNTEFDRFVAAVNYLDFFAGVQAFTKSATTGLLELVTEPIGYDTVVYRKDAFDKQVREEGFKALAMLEFVINDKGKDQKNNNFKTNKPKEEKPNA